MPSLKVLEDVIRDIRGVLFPDYFGPYELNSNIEQYIEESLRRIYKNLKEQIKRELLLDREEEVAENRAQEITLKLLSSLSRIRHILSTDVQAAYEGDPAAKSHAEIIICYPSIKALINYRIAHELYTQNVPLIPRIITEMAHSETGIDIHPGAQIGERFFMDHGTGIVIGETCIIGRNVRIYQGVALGARSFPLDEKGKPIKGIPRHPIVEDNVIIYSGATILGRVKIGHDSVIGGNVWLTRDVPPGSKIAQARVERNLFEEGGGI